MNKYEYTECQGCGSARAIINFVPKYHGFRGQCLDCGSNWPES